MGMVMAMLMAPVSFMLGPALSSRTFLPVAQALAITSLSGKTQYHGNTETEEKRGLIHHASLYDSPA